MDENEYFRFDTKNVLIPFGFVILMWLVYWLEIQFHFRWTRLGIYPLEWHGLKGILFGPFIHGNLEHLWSNTLPSLILLSALVYFYRPISIRILFWGLLLTGVLTWCIGRPSYHIGASGVIYMLTSFLFFKGVWLRHYKLMALSFVVVFLYGSMVWYVLPVKDGISWEGHLSGAVVGLLLSVVTTHAIPSAKRFHWQEDSYNAQDDPFMRQFDEDGNFFELSKEEEE
ncbi:rhomboid family intramembrane serine protease [Nonlabens xiamenensis]|uniref:rhomboid family intramembrane serine protease n=1 Tax=Nonlabens xiamenensis TaxID=2341043 RepID=UPI000F60B15F|nr:rhomboid family intramembrane serine protease [Nonlabens xiamenensis]